MDAVGVSVKNVRGELMEIPDFEVSVYDREVSVNFTSRFSKEADLIMRLQLQPLLNRHKFNMLDQREVESIRYEVRDFLTKYVEDGTFVLTEDSEGPVWDQRWKQRGQSLSFGLQRLLNDV